MTTPQQDALLSVRDLRKSFGGVHAVDGVDLDIRPGEVVAIVGDNGAGKSTLIKMIAGAYQPDGGTIQLLGRSVTFSNPDDARRAGIETMYQDLALVGDVDAPGNVFLGQEPIRYIAGFIPALDKPRMRRETAQLLERIRISLPELDRPVRQLSGGQRQATAIARILRSAQAKLIIMDEPTASLGVQETRKVIDLIRTLKEQGMTILIISHNLEHVFTVSDRIFVLRLGRVAGVVDTQDVTKEQVVSLIMGGSA